MNFDFRREYHTVAIVSFTLTFLVYLALADKFSHFSIVPAVLTKVFVSIGFYMTIFRVVLSIFHHFIWKFSPYKSFYIAGYWRYTIAKSTARTVIGYARIKQDMYDLTIYGINLGGGGDIGALGFWKGSHCTIDGCTFSYDYEVVGERPQRRSRSTRGRTLVNLFGEPPNLMVGSYFDIPMLEPIPGNLVGSIRFEKCPLASLEGDVAKLFATVAVNKSDSHHEATAVTLTERESDVPNPETALPEDGAARSQP
jgi:hypothetical protein